MSSASSLGPGARTAALTLEAQSGWQRVRWHALGEGLLEILILWRNERIRPEVQRSAPIMAG